MTDSIRLGLLAPLTGLVGLYGPEIVCAARIACSAVNARGGIHGRPLELIVEDDGSLPDTAVPAARRLIEQHGCAALIGCLLSNSRIAVAERVTEPRCIPLLNFSFYEGSISGRHFFSFAALPNQQIEKMIPFMATRFGLKMFFAGNNYEWPRGSIDAAKRALQQLSGDVVGEEYLPIGAGEADIERLLDQVARSGADVFVPYFAGNDQITLLTRFTERGLKRRMAVVMGHYDEMMVSRLPADVREGFYSSNTYFMSLDTAENRQVLRQLARQPGVEGVWPQGNGIMTNFGEGAHVCVHAFANAVEIAHGTQAEALLTALEQTRVIAPQGIVEMDPVTHHAHVNTCLARCNADGTFTIIEHFGRIAPIIPARYRKPRETARLPVAPAPARASDSIPRTAATTPPADAAQRILSVADTAILATDARGLITESNRCAALIFGYREDELVGMSIHQLLPPHFRAHHVAQVQGFVEGPDTERRMSARNEVMGYRKDGSFFPLEASIAKFRNADGWQLVATLHDVSERRKAEQALTRQATHDALTGLPNRGLIRERLANALLRSRRSGANVALLFVDLDGFKPINDTHGHETGDRLLKAVAARLIEQVRPGDTVARLGGDEFVILCEQVEQPDSMAVLADRINDSLRQRFDQDALTLFVTASIGVAIGTGSTHSADDLLRYADTAMYAAKDQGHDRWQFYSESLHEQARLRLSITNGLRTALERHEFSPRFQPIVAADSGRIVGAELLLRWHPPGGEISPAVFIPIAEMTGAIVPIGAWVFEQACRAQAEWHTRWGESAPYVSVNVSARQLNEATLADDFARTLRQTGADPTRLLLEITETALMADVETNLHILRRLAELGLRVAVDDFGTGYSSLAQLTRLPVQVLKIDRAFVDGIDKSPENRAVIRAVISLGRALGLKLVAEGVENSAQLRELWVQGCDFIQGYYCHRPLEETVFVDTVAHELLADVDDLPPSLHFMIYVSRETVPVSPAALDELLESARIYNRAAGITGCLVHQDGYFMQMLEGKRDALLKLIDRIRRDPRHDNLKIVIEGAARRRMFVNWGMTLRDLTTTPDEPDFGVWQQRRISFVDLAEDARTCYNFITAYASGGPTD